LSRLGPTGLLQPVPAAAAPDADALASHRRPIAAGGVHAGPGPAHAAASYLRLVAGAADRLPDRHHGAALVRGPTDAGRLHPPVGPGTRAAGAGPGAPVAPGAHVTDVVLGVHDRRAAVQRAAVPRP